MSSMYTNKMLGRLSACAVSARTAVFSTATHAIAHTAAIRIDQLIDFNLFVGTLVNTPPYRLCRQ